MRLFLRKNLIRIHFWIVIVGVVLRVAVYMQCRCLFIDEANVARNIYERSFSGLTLPLSYEQYAPPLFLWIIKSCTLILGYGEYAYRFFPLLCGIAALALMWRTLKKYAGVYGVCYALTIIAFGTIYIRYSCELKQYGCDMVVGLALIMLALRSDIFRMKKWQFVMLWGLTGSVSIWLCMPSVFMLAGVGVYYLYLVVRARGYWQIPVLSIIGLFWLGQFWLYYLAVLKPQIQSDYLQNCHKEFFLYSMPVTVEKLDHDLNVFNKVLSAMGGKWTISICFHLLTFFAGIVWLSKKQFAPLLLVVVPLCSIIVAAMANQYALTPRLILFAMPLLLIPIAAGVQILFSTKYNSLKAFWVAVALICIINFSGFNLIYHRMENEELTESLAFVQQQKITAANVYVHNLAAPAFIYYTTIHPAHGKWSEIANAHLLNWNSNYDSLGRVLTGLSALVYSWAPEDEITSETEKLRQFHKEIMMQKVTGSRVYIYK